MVAPGKETTDSSPLGLALSGGGVRAALFSLGVVIGLIHAGCHKRLRCVTSVSGGSIVNAVLAHGPRVNELASLKEFEPLASALARTLAGRGVQALGPRAMAAGAWYLLNVIVRAIPTALGFVIALALAMNSAMKDRQIPFDLWSIDLQAIPWRWVVGAAGLSLLIVMVLSRGLFQQALYDSTLGAIGAARKSMPGRLFVKDWAKADPEGSGSEPIMHVLVATELLSGKPMYFSNQFVYCPEYGWSDPGELKTAEALYSSAAFPGVYPPKKLKLKRFRFSAGATSGELPSHAQLADGGVYNNLGMDWFRVLAAQTGLDPAPLWPFGGLPVTPPSIAVDHVIVVNSGAANGRIATLWPMFTVGRIMSVLYENTVRPRLDQLMGEHRPVIDISESPLELAERLKGSGGEVKVRATALIDRLASLDGRYWEDLKRDTAGTPTKLTSTGERTGARLMFHGYLSSLVLLHARFDVPFPSGDQLKGDAYFLSLVNPAVPAQAGDVAAVDKSRSSSSA